MPRKWTGIAPRRWSPGMETEKPSSVRECAARAMSSMRTGTSAALTRSVSIIPLRSASPRAARNRSTSKQRTICSPVWNLRSKTVSCASITNRRMASTSTRRRLRSSPSLSGTWTPSASPAPASWSWTASRQRILTSHLMAPAASSWMISPSAIWTST